MALLGDGVHPTPRLPTHILLSYFLFNYTQQYILYTFHPKNKLLSFFPSNILSGEFCAGQHFCRRKIEWDISDGVFIFLALKFGVLKSPEQTCHVQVQVCYFIFHHFCFLIRVWAQHVSARDISLQSVTPRGSAHKSWYWNIQFQWGGH